MLRLLSQKLSFFRSTLGLMMGLAGLMGLPACARDTAYAPSFSLGLAPSSPSNQPAETSTVTSGFTQGAAAPAHSGVSVTSDPFFSPDETGRAAELRDNLSRSFASTAPSDRDWRDISGISRKGPTIIGLGLRYDLSNDKWSYRMGAMKRGSRSKVLTRLSLTLDEM